jgi:hypothetical protein
LTALWSMIIIERVSSTPPFGLLLSKVVKSFSGDTDRPENENFKKVGGGNSHPLTEKIGRPVVPSQGQNTTSSISSFLLIWIRVLISYHQPWYIIMSGHKTEEHVVQSLFIFSITGKERRRMNAECLILKLRPAHFVSVNQYDTITATEFTGILHRKLTHCWVWPGHQPPSHNSTTSTSTRN